MIAKVQIEDILHILDQTSINLYLKTTIHIRLHHATTQYLRKTLTKSNPKM